jgi:hypothetical protein
MRRTRRCRLFVSPSSPPPVRSRRSFAARLSEPPVAVTVRKHVPLPRLSRFCRVCHPGANCVGNRAPQLDFGLRRRVRRRTPPSDAAAMSSRQIYIWGTRSRRTRVNWSSIPVNRLVRCCFSERPLGFCSSTSLSFRMQRSSHMDPVFYALDPELLGFSTRCPCFMFLHCRPYVFICNYVLAIGFLLIYPCRFSFPANKPP